MSTSMSSKHLAAVIDAVSAETGVTSDSIFPDSSFHDMGVESVLRVAIIERLERIYGPLSKSLLFEMSTVFELVEYLEMVYDEKEGVKKGLFSETSPSSSAPSFEIGVNIDDGLEGDLRSEPSVVSVGSEPESGAVGVAPAIFTKQDNSLSLEPTASDSSEGMECPTVNEGRADDDDIAVIGMAGQFPMADDIAEYWSNLNEGKDCIEEIPSRLWDWRNFWDERAGIPGRSYSRWGGFIPDHRLFDPAFFNMSRLEANSIDPQERVFLETVYHALEDAQYPRKKREGKRIGLYVAAMWGSYQHYGSMTADAGASYATIANRASFALGLTGPSIPVDTMCSGSLVTLHLGIQSLRADECDMAVVGGVNLTTHPNKYFVLCRTGFAARDGRCKPFSANADGYVPSEGSGALVIKKRSAAERDGDRILAIVKGTAVNHGGRVSNFTMPNVEAQVSLMDNVLASSGTPAEKIDYVEAHAPGTVLGDPIEVRSLTRVFERQGVSSADIPIGSVKSNVGHLESAAGIAGVVKVIEQMRNKTLVPSIHSSDVNENIDFGNSPFRLQDSVSPWVPQRNAEGRGEPYRALINCFGAGGTNATVLLESVPEEEGISSDGAEKRAQDREEIFLLSAASVESLRLLVGQYIELVESFLNRGNTDRAKELERVVTGVVADTAGIAVRFVEPEDSLGTLLPEDDEVERLVSAICRFTGVVLSTEVVLGCRTVDDLVQSVQRCAIPGCLPRTEQAEREWFSSLSYATRTGRDSMEYRLAILAESPKAFLSHLRSVSLDYESVITGRDGVLQGRVAKSDSSLASKEVNQEYIGRLIAQRNLGKLGSLWVQGVDVEWSDPPVRPSVEANPPLYPFDHKVCWAPQERPGDSRAKSLSVDVGGTGGSAERFVQTPVGKQARVVGALVENAGKRAETFVARIEQKEDCRFLKEDEVRSIRVECQELQAALYLDCFVGDGLVAEAKVSNVPSAGFATISMGAAQESVPEAEDSADCHEAKLGAAEEEALVEFSLGSNPTPSTLLQEMLDSAVDAFNLRYEPILTGEVVGHRVLPQEGSFILQRFGDYLCLMVVDKRNDPILTCNASIVSSLVPTAPGELRRFESQWCHFKPSEEPNPTPRRVLFFASSQQEASILQQTPRFRKADCQTVILTSTGNSHLFKDGGWSIRLGDYSGLRSCLRLVDKPDVIVFVAGGREGRAAEEVVALHAVAKEMASRAEGGQGNTDVTVVTRGAVGPLETVTTPSGLPGYVHTMSRELRGSVAHLDIESESGISGEEADAISRVLTWGRLDRPLALRNKEIFRETLQETVFINKTSSRFRRGGHYLMIGGPGTIGRQLSLQLAKTHQARITWVSRSEVSSGAQQVIDQVRSLGGDVWHGCADVCDFRALQEVVGYGEEQFGPLDGILHLTMNRDIRRIPDVTEEDFREGISGKVGGTDSVVELAKTRDLDFVLLFSSFDAYVGSVGWSSYTAGCSYQLGVAGQAVARDLPIYAVAWGFWEGIGTEVAEGLSVKGIGLINSSKGVSALNSVLNGKEANAVFAIAEDHALARMGFDILEPSGEDPRALSVADPKTSEGLRFSAEEVEGGNAIEVGATSLVVSEEGMGSREKVLENLRNLFAEVLRTEPESLDPDTDLLNYGVDSLLIVNIQATIEEQLGPVPTALLLDNSNLRHIAEAIERDHPEISLLLQGGGDNTLSHSVEPPLSSVEGSISHEQEDSLLESSPPLNAETSVPSQGNNASFSILRRVPQHQMEDFFRSYPRLFDEDRLRSAAGLNLGSGAFSKGDLVHGLVELEGGAEVEVFRVGEGDPVVLLCAVALTAPVWLHVMNSSLTDEHELIVVHQPGYGLSTPITGCDNRGVARATRAALKAMGITGAVHLAASCLGSVPAMHFAADYPAETASLTLIGAFHDASDLDAGDPSTMSSKDFQDLAESSIATLHRDFDAVLDATSGGRKNGAGSFVNDCRQLLLDSQKANFLVALRYLNEMMGISMMPVLNRITAPTLCLYGDADQIIDPRHSIEISEALQGTRRVCVKGAGHFPYLTHPEIFIAEYEAFIERLGSSGPVTNEEETKSV